MKITGNEAGKELPHNTVKEEAIQSLAKSDFLSERMFFDSLEVQVDIKESNYEDGEFKAQFNFEIVKELPTITVGIENKQLVEDLFRNSNTSADNREGILSFIKAGVLNAIVNSFSQSVFQDNLQILDEKLKSKTIEIQQANIQSGDLKKTEEVPNLVTSQEELSESKVEPLKEQDDLKAEGYDEHSLIEDEPVHNAEAEKEAMKSEASENVEAVDFTAMAEDIEDTQPERGATSTTVIMDEVAYEDDDEVPANYKPLSDGTTDNQPLKAKETEEEAEDDEDELEPIGKLSH